MVSKLNAVSSILGALILIITVNYVENSSVRAFNCGHGPIDTTVIDIGTGRTSYRIGCG